MNLKNLNYNKKHIIKIYNTKHCIISQQPKLSLLKILLKNHINISYQCQSGYCGSCSVQLVYGKIQYFQKNLIAYIKPKHILPCCCIIQSNVKIII